jgi:hypothetical protein
MPPHTEFIAVTPILVLVVKASGDNNCRPLTEDLARAERVAASVRAKLDQIKDSSVRVIHSGETEVAFKVAEQFRVCIIHKPRPTVTTVSAFSTRGIDPDSDDFHAVARQVTRHLYAQLGCDALIAVLSRELINLVVLENYRARGVEPPMRFALKPGEACMILREGVYHEFREPPPATAATAP